MDSVLRRLVLVTIVVFAGAIGAQNALAATPSITASPKSFGSGQTVKVSGTGFAPGETINVWFDGNHDGLQGSQEPSDVVQADSTGAFTDATFVAKGDDAIDGYDVFAGTPLAVASSHVHIGTCLFQECMIDGMDNVCIVGKAPSDTISYCKVIDTNYTDSPTGYDFRNQGSRFAGAGILAAAVNSLNVAGIPTGCGAMTTAIAEAELPPYSNSVPGKYDFFKPTQELLNIACAPPFGPLASWAPGFDLPLYFATQTLAGHLADPAMQDAAIILALVQSLQAGGTLFFPPGLIAAQYAFAKAAVAGAIVCGFVDYYCNGSDITGNIMLNNELQKKLVPMPFLNMRWGDIIGWGMPVCHTNTMPPKLADGTYEQKGICEAPQNPDMVAQPGTAGPNNLASGVPKCATGTVEGLSIGYDGDVSFDVNDGFNPRDAPVAADRPGIAQLTNYHNFLPGPGGSAAPDGIDVEVPPADRGRFFPTLAQLRKGVRVIVCGFWVADMHQLWNELHPMTFLAILPAVPVDSTPPVITPHVSGTFGDHGWYTSDVTVTWTVTDPDSPVTSKTGCDPVTITVDTPTAGQTLTCTASNAGGTSADGVTIKRDTTAPTIGHAISPAAPDGSNGWYVSAPTVTFSCSDASSDIASCVADGHPGPLATLGEDASAQTVTGTAVDNAGNVSHDSASGLLVDLSDPQISAATDRPANANGWFNASVDVSFTCTDAISGAGFCPAPKTVGEGADQSASGTTTDVAGRSASTTVAHINVDTTAPGITYSGNAGTYTVDQTVHITCSASDALSGVASSSCADISGPAYSFGLGTTLLSASAIDRAGNIGTGSTSFVVIVTPASLDALITQFFGSNHNGANGLIAKVDAIANAPNAHAKSGALGAFDNQVDAKTGNPLTAAQAALLKELAAAL